MTNDYLNEEPELISFADLPIENRYNKILAHNKSLIKQNDLLVEYSDALEYRIKQLEIAAAQKPKIENVKIVKEVLREVKVLVPTPDAIGNELARKAQIQNLVARIETLNSELGSQLKEIAALKKILKHRR